jgi:hypothetical protein
MIGIAAWRGHEHWHFMERGASMNRRCIVASLPGNSTLRSARASSSLPKGSWRIIPPSHLRAAQKIA